LGVSPKPPRAPNCQHLSSASAPAITSPKRGVEYQVLAGSTLELRAHSDASVRRLYIGSPMALILAPVRQARR